MATNAIVIKGADFAANKLATVTFIDGIPCTAISLDETSKVVTSVTPFTLKATPTPENTTDAIYWSSSDENVVTVLNGVCTIVGVGTATITATCGGKTASCDVDASEIIVDADYGFFSLVQYDTTFIRSSESMKHFSIYNADLYGTMRGFRVGDQKTGCPIPLLKNVSDIVVSAKDTYPDPVYVFFADTNQAAASGYDTCCKLISSDNANSGVVTNKFTYTYSVPEGANAVAIRFRMRSEASASDDPATYVANHEVSLKFKAAS